MPRDSAAADRPASYLVGTAAAFPLFFRDRTKPINQLPFSPSAKFPKSGSSCESRANMLTAEVSTRAAPLGGVNEAPTDRRLSVRERSLRDHGRAAISLYLPLPGLPTPDQQRVLVGDRCPREGVPPDGV